MPGRTAAPSVGGDSTTEGVEDDGEGIQGDYDNRR
jgi:hypothetical protein